MKEYALYKGDKLLIIGTIGLKLKNFKKLKQDNESYLFLYYEV